MWKVAAKAEDIRLYFSVSSVVRRNSEEVRSALQASVESFRAAIGSTDASKASEVLLQACDQHGLREEVERLADACSNNLRSFNEQDAQQVIPGLWVGPLGPAESVDWIRVHAITHIIDTTGGWRRRVSALENSWERQSLPPHASSGIQYLVVDAEDRPTFDISQLFEQTNQFIDAAFRHAVPSLPSVLVHCHSGVSRSASIVLAYLMSEYRLTVRESLRVLRDARPSVAPNPGFEKQLIRYELRLKTAARTSSATAKPAPIAKRSRSDDAISLGSVDSATSASLIASGADELISDAEIESLEVECALERLQAHMGCVPKFTRVASALEKLLTDRMCVANAPAFHTALRKAIGNGKGPKLPKLRASYCSLFDAAMARLELFSEDLAADVSAWHLCAAIHSRITKPGLPLTAAEAARLISQVIAVLKRQVAEKYGGLNAHKCGGSLRGLMLSLLYEILETLFGLWKKEPELQQQLLETFGLAEQLGGCCWPPEQQRNIEKWSSTVRARIG